jgi:integrase
MKEPRYGEKHREGEGTIRLYEKAIPNKHAPKYWVVMLEWRDPANRTKRVYDRAPNWPEARKLAKKIRRDLEAGAQSFGKSKSFAKAFDEWLATQRERHELKDLRRGSYENIAGRRDKYVEWFGDNKLDKITGTDIKGFLAHWAKQGRKYASLIALHSTLKLFLDFAAEKDQRWIAGNPMRDDRGKLIVKVPGEPEGRINPPKWHEVEALIEFLHGPRPFKENNRAHGIDILAWWKRRIIFALGAFAGLRAGEVAALRWERIDITRGMRLEVHELDGNRTAWGLGPPKTKAGARKIPICNALYEELLAYGDFVGKGTMPTSGFVVFRNWGDRAGMGSNSTSGLTSDSWRRAGILNENGERDSQGNIKPKYDHHYLRHFYVSARLQLGQLRQGPHSLHRIARDAGHEKADFTLRRYGHVIDDDEEEYREEIPEIWHDRYTRAKPLAPLVQMDHNGALVIDGTAELIAVTERRYRYAGGPEIPNMIAIEGPPSKTSRGGSYIYPAPAGAPEWLQQAIALINAGWNDIREIAKRVGRDNVYLPRAFRQFGLPTPYKCVQMVRAARFQELHDAGHDDADIAHIMDCHVCTVTKWRQHMQLPENAKSLTTREYQTTLKDGVARDLRHGQLKLL